MRSNILSVHVVGFSKMLFGAAGEEGAGTVVVVLLRADNKEVEEEDEDSDSESAVG